MSREKRGELAIALAWGLVVAAGAYPVLRTLEYVLRREAYPSTSAWSPHSPFLWRCFTALYAGGIGAFVAFAAGRNRPSASARGLADAVVAAALAAALQAIARP
jgi:hypothetical protein